MRRSRHSYEVFLILLSLMLCGVTSAAWGLDPQISLGRLARQTWSTDNGLPQNSAHAILQTSDGFLWIATEGGLARFDGYQFRIFDTESTPRLPANDIRGLLEDRNGALWIGTAAGLTRLKNEEAQTYTTSNGLPSDTVQAMLLTADGSLWVQTTAGLATADPNGKSSHPEFHGFTPDNGMAAESVTSMAPDSGGGIWVGTAHGLFNVTRAHIRPSLTVPNGVALGALTVGSTTPGSRAPSLLLATPDAVIRLNGGVATTLATQTALPAGGVHILVETSEGVWAAGKSGLTLIRGAGAQKFFMGKDLPGSQIYTLFKDRHDVLWIGTNAGLARWSHGKMETISDVGNSAFSAVLSIFEDREGNLWTGTETGGVGVLRAPLFEVIGRREGLADEAVTSVVQLRDKGIWVGTSEAGLTRIDLAGSSGRVYTAKDGLASETILSLASAGGTASGPAELWVGTPDGLNLLQGGRWKLFTSADGLPDDFVRSLLSGSSGVLWIGTRRGVTRWTHGRGTTWTTAQGLGSDLVGAMVEDVNGDLWIGTLAGLSRMHDGRITNFTVANGLPSNVITALEQAASGGLWIGSKDQGLALFSGNRFFSFAKAAKLPKNIYAILLDGLGSLWLSSDRGIYRVSLGDLDAFRAGTVNDIPLVTFSTSDGLPSVEGSGTGHPSAWRLADGRLCFASRRGVIVFDPRADIPGDAVVPVVVEQATIDGRNASPIELESIAAGASHLSFSFAGIHLAAPQRVQYRYMLEGFDKDWVEAGLRRTAFYTNLSPGRYRLRVSARISGGPWSEAGASLSLRLRPRFYQTAIFRGMLLLFIAIALVAIYRLRVRTLQDRFAAVGAERNRLAREIHDTLAQGFVAVSVRLEIMSQLLRRQSIEDCREQLDQTRSLVRESLAEARRSIWDLRSEGTDSMTLPARLARSVQQASSSSLTTRFDTTGTYRPLDIAIEDELFRIAQEAIANAVNHAKASTATIHLAYTAQLLSLEVVDDGCGFDLSSAPSGPEGHFGLIGMRERAQKIGATVILESAAGTGTRIRVDKRLSTRTGGSGKEVPHG